MYLAHSKKLLPTSGAPSNGLHLPCTSSPFTVVLTTYSSASLKSVFLTLTVR